MSAAVGESSGGDDRGRDWNLLHFPLLALEFGIFLVLLFEFDIESRAFRSLAVFSFFGWCIHYFLPLKYRLGFFVFLSLAGIELVFGLQTGSLSLSGLLDGLWIVGVGLLLIGVCHLPWLFEGRVALLLLIGAVLAAARSGFVSVPWPLAVWPVLASMFMFRLIVYLYQLRHAKKRPGALETLAYFFMLPNVCFPLFPVVDFQTFRRVYYAGADRHQTYQTGLRWLLRGAYHLLLYRLVYQNLVIEAVDVRNRLDLVQYLLWPFLLYLRVSGSFHIITGLLHLFGFNLPPTHKLYYLSSSFTDLWRRVNIYWKDFIMQVVYYPCYMRIRGWGETRALIVATLIAFFATWLLHAYQWMWIRGVFLLSWNDALFWAMLATLVLGNTLFENKYGRRRRLAGAAISWREVVPTVLRTVGVFATMCVLWSFWSANSVGEWLSTWEALGVPSGSPLEPVLALGAIALAVGVPAALLARGVVERPFDLRRSALAGAAPAALLIAVSFTGVSQSLGPVARAAMADAKAGDLNPRHYAALEQGYYEKLFDLGGFNPELWAVYRSRPLNWLIVTDENGREVDWLRPAEGPLPLPDTWHAPNLRAIHRGARMETNRWGMRDRDYELDHGPDTFRIAIIGTSYVFGSGVDQGKNFESLLENRLNREVDGGPYRRYEVLNFGKGGMGPIARLILLEQKALPFGLDGVIWTEQLSSARAAVKDAMIMLQARVPHGYGFLDRIAREAGVDEKSLDDAYLLRRKLAPYEEEILLGIYRHVAQLARDRGFGVVWVYVPQPQSIDAAGAPPHMVTAAQEAGFSVLDLTGAYDGHVWDDLWVATWDRHPNALGHELIAEKLYLELRRQGDRTDLAFSGGRPGPAAGTGSSIRPTEEQ